MENKQFEEWLSNYNKTLLNHKIETGAQSIAFSLQPKDIWSNLPFSMQWGVYLEFFDSVGITIQISPDWDYTKIGGTGDLTFEYIVFGLKPPGEGLMGFKTRQEAQQEAIKKAFEILSND